ncbi:MAG: thioredoxin family protein [Methanotrichaceae archaeon]|nr:thioredoxin family protein [Methanotrichaceae archaeon]MDD1758193.1 thioredoxin family protein [Methanotrichaceae archaeon]
MVKLSVFGSVTVIILLNSLLSTIPSSQGELDSNANPVLNISDANIDSAISRNPALVLDCYKSGCGPCVEMDVALDEIAQDFRGKVMFGKIDMKENLETKEKYKIRSYPTLLLFDDEMLIDRIVGYTSKESIEDEIASSFSLAIPQ